MTYGSMAGGTLNRFDQADADAFSEIQPQPVDDETGIWQRSGASYFAPSRLNVIRLRSTQAALTRDVTPAAHRRNRRRW